MDIELYRSGPVTFMRIEGGIDAVNCIEVRNMILDAMKKCKFFVVNLNEVPRMDSTAIRTLMGVIQELELDDGMLKLVCRIRTSAGCKLVNVERVFGKLYDKPEEAVKALGFGSDTVDCTPPPFAPFHRPEEE